MADVVTIEGIGDVNVRYCAGVKPGADGRTCRCAGYKVGPSSEKRSFKDMCREAGLSIKIGKTTIGGGLQEAAMDYPPLDDIFFGDGSFGFFDEIITPEQLKGLLMSAGGGAAGIVAASLVSKIPTSIPVLGTNDWVKGLLGLVVGLVGGRLLWDKQRDLACSFSAGAAGVSALALVNKLASNKIPASGPLPLPLATVAGLFGQLPQDINLVGYGAHPQLGAITVESEQRLAGVTVEQDSPLAGDEGYLHGGYGIY